MSSCVATPVTWWGLLEPDAETHQAGTSSWLSKGEGRGSKCTVHVSPWLLEAIQVVLEIDIVSLDQSGYSRSGEDAEDTHPWGCDRPQTGNRKEKWRWFRPGALYVGQFPQVPSSCQKWTRIWAMRIYLGIYRGASWVTASHWAEIICMGLVKQFF